MISSQLPIDFRPWIQGWGQVSTSRGPLCHLSWFLRGWIYFSFTKWAPSLKSYQNQSYNYVWSDHSKKNTNLHGFTQDFFFTLKINRLTIGPSLKFHWWLTWAHWSPGEVTTSKTSSGPWTSSRVTLSYVTALRNSGHLSSSPSNKKVTFWQNCQDFFLSFLYKWWILQWKITGFQSRTLEKISNMLAPRQLMLVQNVSTRRTLGPRNQCVERFSTDTPY